MLLLAQPDPQLAAMVEALVGKWAPERIVLFGSRARGDHEELSDYDLLVVVPDERYYKGLPVDIRRDLDALPCAKDIVVARHSTLEKQAGISGTIYHEALTEGQTLYAAA